MTWLSWFAVIGALIFLPPLVILPLFIALKRAQEDREP